MQGWGVSEGFNYIFDDTFIRFRTRRRQSSTTALICFQLELQDQCISQEDEHSRCTQKTQAKETLYFVCSKHRVILANSAPQLERAPENARMTAIAT